MSEMTRLVILLYCFAVVAVATRSAILVSGWIPPTVAKSKTVSRRLDIILATNSESCDLDPCDNSISSSIRSSKQTVGRRDLVAMVASASFVSILSTCTPQAAFAAGAGDTNNKPQEFINVGTQAPPPNPAAEDSPFVTLANGVKTKEFKVGSGTESVLPGSRVDVQCSGRLLNLNGVIFYNTKNNNPDGLGAIPLRVVLGKGQAVPGLESGIVGMKKGGIRRIIVPAELAYSKYPTLEPVPMNGNDQRALDSVVKNPRRDATILFDVQLERFK